jgi:hypothetical protein
MKDILALLKKHGPVITFGAGDGVDPENDHGGYKCRLADGSFCYAYDDESNTFLVVKKAEDGETDELVEGGQGAGLEALKTFLDKK